MSTSQSESKKRWTVVDMVNWSADYLGEKNIDNPRLNAEQLLGHILNFSRVQLYTNFDRPLSLDELAEYKILFKRRVAGEPLQYILEETEFFSLPFCVNPNVLIPRPETELLVEKVLEICQEHFDENEMINILDVGTGSGCIAVSIAKNCPNAKVHAADVSLQALDVARKNAEQNETDIHFIEQDALQVWPEEFNNFFNIIVSNPPYVSHNEYNELAQEIRNFEPQLALQAGEKGLDFYQKFSHISPTLLQSNGFLLYEIGETQASDVHSILNQIGFTDIQTLPDLADKDRIIFCKRP